MKRTPEGLAGPVYDSWDEAMSDPDLDLSRPWFVAPPPVAEPVDGPAIDMSGWTDIGFTTDWFSTDP